MKFVVGVMVLVAVIVIVMGMGAIMKGITDWRTDGISDSFILTTNSSETHGSVQLTHPLYNGDTQYVSVLGSNTTSDTPVLNSYVSGNKSLTVTGLASNLSRTLNVTYRTAGLSSYTGADSGISYLPVVLALAILGVVLAAIVYVFASR